jgi:hypothetical protein
MGTNEVNVFQDDDDQVVDGMIQRKSVREGGRRLEDVAYWRKRAGWFDDDVSMQKYNNGVSSTYYELGDDDRKGSSGVCSGAKVAEEIKPSAYS